ncbi:RNA polymerase sigma-70 factor [Larkinella arboricola]
MLFREYYGPLCSHAIRFVYSREVARDLVSDVFYTFWQKELHRHITTSYRAYLYTTVRHRSLNYLQREFCHEANLTNLESAELDQGAFSTASQTPEDIMNYDELLHKVEEVICRMSPQNQKVFMMNRFEGKKYQLIAEELQITLKTVEAHMSKALASLRKALRQDTIWGMLLSYWFL